MSEEHRSGLIHALVLDGKGGARRLSASQALGPSPLAEGETLWLHLDRSHPTAQAWLRGASGLSAFACDVLLEENTRPRLLSLPDEQLLLFLRGVNLNPEAEPEDMVAIRVFADGRRVFSLRLRPSRAADAVVDSLAEGRGPESAGELLEALGTALTERIDDLILELGEHLEQEEERLEADDRYAPDQLQLITLRRRAAGLRRFLLPQREIFTQLARLSLGWVSPSDRDDWNELSNRLIRHLEELELIRERVGLILELQQRRLSERMNRTMYLLAVITVFFLPLSFLTGLLGINLAGIPGAESPFGFAVVCLLAVVIVLGQWLLLRRLRWI